MKPEENKKQPRWVRIVLIYLLVILVVAVGIHWYLKLSVKKDREDAQAQNDAQALAAQKQEENEEPRLSTEEDVFNIILLGTDERTDEFNENARADSIMVVSLDTNLHTIKLASIERGIGVSIPGQNDDLLTHTFRYGGAGLTMNTVRDCFDLDLDRYVRINFSAFVEAVNSIGGVELDLAEREADALGNSLTVGTNHLDGEDALAYSRLRSIDSDWRRVERQRNVIKAAVEQIKTFDMGQITKLITKLFPTVQTNLTVGEMTKLVIEIPDFIKNGPEIEDMTIPAEGTAWNRVGVDGRKMIGVDFEKNAEILHDFFYAGTKDPQAEAEASAEPSSAPSASPEFSSSK